MSEHGLVRVGDGRGFVVQARQRRFVITAAHCIPGRCEQCDGNLPPSHGASYTSEKTYQNVLGEVDRELSVWAELAFADPVADIAVFAEPDGQAYYQQCSAYEALVEGVTPLPVALLPAGQKVAARALSRELRWVDLECKCGPDGAVLWGANLRLEGGPEEQLLAAGTSGSPILDNNGSAIALVSVGAGGPNPTLSCLPVWILRQLQDGDDS